MIKNALMFFGGLVTFIWAHWFAGPNLKYELYGIAIGFSIALIAETISFLYMEWSFLVLYFNSQVTKRNIELRLSIAYLYNIECNGKYLLVKNARFGNVTYQPVGGVYKYFHPEASKELAKMTIVPDVEIENDVTSEYDLRLRMSKRKNLRKFITWFFSLKEREIDPWREFNEELIETKILPSAHFKYLYYDLIGQNFEPIHKDSYFKVDTFKYVDIYKPRFINQIQKDELRKLLNLKSEQYIWATQDEINKKISHDGKRISDHAHKIFITRKIK